MALEALLGLGIGGSVLGGLLGASGAKSQAQAQVQAGRDALNAYQGNTDFAKLLQYALLFGADKALQAAPGLVGQDAYERIFGVDATDGGLTPDQQRELDVARQELAALGPRRVTGTAGATRGSTDPRRRDLEAKIASLEAAGGGRAAKGGMMTKDQFKALGNGLYGSMGELATKYKAQGDEQLAGLDRLIADVNARASQLGANADQYYDQEVGQAERDASRAIDSGNRRTLAQAAASGVGGSIAGSQIAANQKYGLEALRDATRRIRQSQVGFQTDLGNRNLDRQQSLSLARFGAGQDNLLRNLQLDQAPLQSQFSFFTGNTFNPFLGQDTTKYYPGVSPSGAFGSSVGNTLGALGGTATGIGGQAMLYDLLMKGGR